MSAMLPIESTGYPLCHDARTWPSAGKRQVLELARIGASGTTAHIRHILLVQTDGVGVRLPGLCRLIVPARRSGVELPSASFGSTACRILLVFASSRIVLCLGKD